jgi:hypothetical protein
MVTPKIMREVAPAWRIVQITDARPRVFCPLRFNGHLIAAIGPTRSSATTQNDCM